MNTFCSWKSKTTSHSSILLCWWALIWCALKYWHSEQATPRPKHSMILLILMPNSAMNRTFLCGTPSFRFWRLEKANHTQTPNPFSNRKLFYKAWQSAQDHASLTKHCISRILIYYLYYFPWTKICYAHISKTWCARIILSTDLKSAYPI